MNKFMFHFILLFVLCLSSCKKNQNVTKFSELKVLVSEPYFFEAPAYDAEFDLIYFTGYKNNKENIYQCLNGKMVLVPDTNGVGGTYIAPDGYFYAANGAGHELLRYSRSKNGLVNREVLYQNNDMHQPNDLCVSSKGVVYFTDPDFKLKKTGGVYVWSKESGARKVISHLPCPNGIMLTKNEKKIIISDSHLKEWKIYDIDGNGDLINEKLFFKPKTENTNSPDGMSRDEAGLLYLTGLGGVWVVNESSKQIGFKAVPEFCSNVFVINQPQKKMILSCANKMYEALVEQ